MKEEFEIVNQQKVPYTLPKAEMHVHISLALSNDTFVRRVKKRRTPLELDFLTERETRYYPNLTNFHETYEACRGMTVDNAELAVTVQEYLERIAREGAIYAEISNSYREGDDFAKQMEAVSIGIEAARANTGIESRIIVTSLRNYGAERAEQAATYLAQNPNPLITGFGLVGDESVNPFSDFERALNIAWHDAGLGLTPHVAEQHVHNAVDFLEVVPSDAWTIARNDHRRLRVGHGVLIHTSSDLIKEFADRQICMELCLSANKRIGLPEDTKMMTMGQSVASQNGNRTIIVDRELQHYYERVEDHPIKTFLDAGISVCLGSDNPLLMNTNIGKEYSLAHKAGVTDEFDHLRLTENAILNANLDELTRKRLMQHIIDYRVSMNAGITPKSTALGYIKATID